MYKLSYTVPSLDTLVELYDANARKIRIKAAAAGVSRFKRNEYNASAYVWE